MNILFITKNFYIGGIAIVTAYLANKFQRAGHNVAIWNFTRTEISSQDKIDKNIKVEFGYGLRPSNNNIKSLRAAIINNKIDVVINQTGLSFFLAYTVRKATKGLNVKLISVFHNDPSTNARIQSVDIDIAKTNSAFKKHYLKIKRHLYKMITATSMRYVFHRSDIYVLLSKSFINGFKDFTGVKDTRKICSITNPITIDTSNYIFDTSKKQKDVVYVGRLDPNQKRVHRVLETWKLIEKKHSDWTLRIVGDGNERKELERLIEQYSMRNVRLEGFKEPRPYYEKASVLLLTSEYEGFGLVIVEGMSFGVVPIVLGSYSAVHDIIEDDKDGFIIPYCKQKGFVAKDMADKLEFLISNEDKRNEMAWAAIEKSKMFSIDKICDDWMNLFDRLNVK